jgi:hypothetical protein
MAKHQTVYRVVHRLSKAGPWNSHLAEPDLPEDCDATSAIARDRYWREVEAAREIVAMMADRDGYMNSHPNARTDFGRGFWNERKRCAVDSLEGLDFWFDRDTLNHLQRCNFVVHAITLEASKVKCSFSGTQVAFDYAADIISEEFIELDVLTF